jgi:hypothetical protein
LILLGKSITFDRGSFSAWPTLWPTPDVSGSRSGESPVPAWPTFGPPFVSSGMALMSGMTSPISSSASERAPSR